MAPPWISAALVLLASVGRAQIPGQSVPETIVLGGLFHSPEDRVAQYAFEYSTEAVNDDRSTLIRSRLVNAIDNQVVPKDSFKASQKSNLHIFRNSVNTRLSLSLSDV